MCSLCSGPEVVKYVPQKAHRLRLYSGSSLFTWTDLENGGKMEKRRRRKIGDQPPLLAWPRLLCKTHGDSWRRRNCPHVGILVFIITKSSPGISLEGMMLKLKLQYFGHLMWRVDSLEKTLMLGGIGAGGEGDDRGWDGWMASLTRWTWV